MQYEHALVTGGAGFIGSHICERLVGLGLAVASLDDYSAGKTENLAHLPTIREFKCDVTCINSLQYYFKAFEPDIIFHNAASKKNICLRDPTRDLAVNGGGTLNMLLMAREFGVKKFVHASTGSVYGEPIQFPQTEEHPLNPCSYYGVSKLAGERYASLFHNDGLDVTILRYFHVYGSRQESDPNLGGVVAIFCRQVAAGLPITIHGDGRQVRSFTHVDDVVGANLLAAQSSGGTYNCASGTQISIVELAEAIEGLAGHKVSRQLIDPLPGDIRHFDVSNERIKVIGMTNWTDFEEGLHATYNWYESRHPDKVA